MGAFIGTGFEGPFLRTSVQVASPSCGRRSQRRWVASPSACLLRVRNQARLVEPCSAAVPVCDGWRACSRTALPRLASGHVPSVTTSVDVPTLNDAVAHRHVNAPCVRNVRSACVPRLLSRSVPRLWRRGCHRRHWNRRHFAEEAQRCTCGRLCAQRRRCRLRLLLTARRHRRVRRRRLRLRRLVGGGLT